MDLKRELEDIYRPLEGKIFDAVYKKRTAVPSTGNFRDVLSVTDPDVTSILKQILQKIESRGYNKRVWKGIIERSNGEYHLYIKPLGELHGKEGKTFKFQVQSIKIWKGEVYEAGVDIVLDVIN